MAALLKPLLKQIVVGAPYIFTPLELFSGGEQGAWYDPSDLATLYQDSAGTTPVATDGDPVGLMLDKSGNGNHATQSSSDLKPIYRTDGTLHWLEFDGFDDTMLSLTTLPLQYGQTAIAGVSIPSTGDGSTRAVFGLHSGTSYFGIHLRRDIVRPAATNRFSGGAPTIVAAGNASVATYLAVAARQNEVTVDAQTSYAGGAEQGSSIVQGSPEVVSLIPLEIVDPASSSPTDFYGGIFVDRFISESERSSSLGYINSLGGY